MGCAFYRVINGGILLSKSHSKAEGSVQSASRWRQRGICQSTDRSSTTIWYISLRKRYQSRCPNNFVQSLEIGIKHVGDELRELNYMCVKQSSSGPQFVGLFVTLSVGLPLIQYPTTAKESTPSRPSTAFLTQLLAYCQLSFPTSPPWSSMYRCLSLLDERIGTSYLFFMQFVSRYFGFGLLPHPSLAKLWRGLVELSPAFVDQSVT